MNKLNMILNERNSNNKESGDVIVTFIFIVGMVLCALLIVPLIVGAITGKGDRHYSTYYSTPGSTTSPTPNPTSPSNTGW